MQTYDSSLFIRQSYFINNRSQNFSIFHPFLNIFKTPPGLTGTTVAWKSEKIIPKLNWHNSKMREKFKESCSKQDKVTCTPRNVVNYN